MQDQIIVAVFPSRQILLKALDHLLEDVALDIRKAAVVVKSATGDILVLNDDLGGEDGAIIGGLVGAVTMSLGLGTLGMLALPGSNSLIALSFSAIIGGIIGWLVGQFVSNTFQFGFDRSYVDAIAGKLQEGTTALMIRVEDRADLLPKLQAELEPYKVLLVEQLRELQSSVKS